MSKKAIPAGRQPQGKVCGNTASVPDSSMEHLRQIAEHMLDITCKVNIKGHIEYISPSCEILSGFSPQRLIGKPILEFIHHDDHASVSRIVETGIREKIPIRMEFRHRCVAGGFRWVESIGSLIFKDSGRVAGIVYGTRDITERKRIEQELRSSKQRLRILFEAAPDAYYLTDLKGNFLDGNRSAEQLIGYGKSELIGASYFDLDLLPADQVPGAMDALEHLKNGLPSDPREFILKRKDGVRVHVEIRSYPVTIDGKMVALGIARDITRRKKAEAELRKAHAQLEQKVRQRTASLEEANTALRVLLRERGRDRGTIEEKMRFNVDELILPYLEKLKSTRLNDRQKTLLEVIESNLQDILTPLIPGVPMHQIRLTPTEIKVANLIRQGRTTKEIATIANLSPRTIEGHRNNIRRRLGIARKKINLHTYLLSSTLNPD